MKILGIDPGTHTGVALWNVEAQSFDQVGEMMVHRALEFVASLNLTGCVPVIFEDARKRTWFGSMDAQQRKYGNAVREGAGAAKRDASIWDDYLEDKAIPYIARAPSAGSTKWDAEKFRRLSRWEHRTNEHARDAGVLVCGIRAGEWASVVRSWEQSRANKTPRTSARR